MRWVVGRIMGLVTVLFVSLLAVVAAAVIWVLDRSLRPVVMANFMIPVRQRFHMHDPKYKIRFNDQHEIISATFMNQEKDDSVVQTGEK